MRNEFCIMKEDANYKIKREYGLERHEPLFGGRNRSKCIEDGLIVFLTPELHRGTYGVHGKYGHEFDLYLKRKAQESWQEYYNKSEEEFIKRYGRSYL